MEETSSHLLQSYSVTLPLHIAPAVLQHLSACSGPVGRLGSVQGPHPFGNLQEIVANISVLGPAPGLMLRPVVNAATFMLLRNSSCDTARPLPAETSSQPPQLYLQACRCNGKVRWAHNHPHHWT